jgi:holo-[acyl-carrier protein] synthase
MTPEPGIAVVVGVDLVRIGDVADSMARFGDRYTNRLFTEGEIRYCRQESHLAGERFAARFAAKEATIKVLRPKNTDAVSWRSIEVRRMDDGWCEIVLHGGAEALARREGVSRLSVSMSHEQEYAIATVVGQRQSTQR